MKVIEHISDIAAQLEDLPPVKRELFSLWCCQPLLDEFGKYLAERIGAATVASLRSTIEMLWKQVLEGTPVSSTALQDAREVVASIIWSEDDVSEGQEFDNFGAIELAGCLELVCETFASGSSRSAAETAERMINRVDYELSMIEGVDRPEEDSRFLSEIERQQLMLEHLEKTPEVSHADRNRFRE